jgi:putative hemolysin
MALELLFVVLLIVGNGLFAMSELAVVSARKARLQRQAASGIRGAQAALDLARAPAPFLSTVQIGITLVGILAGAFGGATLAEKISAGVARVPLVAPYREAIGLGVVVVMITYLSVVIGELVPKRLALLNPERIAAAVAGPMRALTRMAHPLVRILTASSDLALRLFGVRAEAEEPITPEEVRILIEQGARAGVFETVEKEIVDRVLRLGSERVAALMTPRTSIVWLDVEQAVDSIRETIASSRLSRFPVAQGTLDNVVGLVLAKDLLARLLEGLPFDLKAALREPLFVPETMGALEVLEHFKRSSEHIALVIDEHGGVSGLVTHHDLLEAVLGAIAEQPMQLQDGEAVQREDGSWLIGGMLPLGEFKEKLGIPRLPGEERGDVHTMGGFAMLELGRIPSAGEHFEAAGMRFEVVDMDGRRVDKLLVSRLPQPPAEPEEEDI